MALKKQKNNKALRTVRSITLTILDILLSMAENFAITMDRKEVYKAVYGYRENELSVEKISRHFASLKKRGYLEVEKKKGKESIRFTNKAKMALLDVISAKLEEDDRYHFISFDIPEPKRRNRDAFRRTIKRLGCKEVQKSLWVCKKDIGEFVEMAAKEYKVSDYVVYMVTDITNINQALEKILKKKRRPKSNRQSP